MSEKMKALQKKARAREDSPTRIAKEEKERSVRLLTWAKLSKLGLKTVEA